MSADHLKWRWWLDDDGNPWVEHDCSSTPEPWRLPNGPWRYVSETNSITPSVDCTVCGSHTLLYDCDRDDHRGVLHAITERHKDSDFIARRDARIAADGRLLDRMMSEPKPEEET